MNPREQYAEYLKTPFSKMPVHGRFRLGKVNPETGKKGKVPVGEHGVKSFNETAEAVIQTLKNDELLGFYCSGDDVVCLDYDHYQPEFENGYCETSVSGAGAHALVLLTDDIKKTLGTLNFTKKALLTDKNEEVSPEAEKTTPHLELFYKGQGVALTGKGRLYGSETVKAGTQQAEDILRFIHVESRKQFESERRGTIATSKEGQDDARIIIDRFNDQHSVTEYLAGYEPDKNNPFRWLWPGSTTGVAGVVVFPDGTLFSHHPGDPLYGTHDAFDCFRIIECGGDWAEAFKRARQELGIKPSRKNKETGKEPKDEQPKETEFTEKDLEEAEKIYNEGRMLEHLVKSCQEEHVGDDIIIKCMILSFADALVENSGGIHLSITGKAGSGKSHAAKTAVKHFPKNNVKYGGMSDKALLYNPIPERSVIVLDDEKMSETLQGVMKQATSSWDKPAQYMTVINQEGTTLTIPPRLTWWIVQADKQGDEQVLDRQLVLWADESEEQHKAIVAAMDREAQTGYIQNKNYGTSIALWSWVKPCTVLIPFTDHIGGKDAIDPRNINLFYSLIRAHAIIHAPKRDKDEKDQILASKEDFIVIANLMNPLFKGEKGSQELKLAKAEQIVLDALMEMDSRRVSVKDIGKVIGKSNDYVLRAFNGRTDKTHNTQGLLSAITGITGGYKDDDGGAAYYWDKDAYVNWRKTQSENGFYWVDAPESGTKKPEYKPPVTLSETIRKTPDYNPTPTKKNEVLEQQADELMKHALNREDAKEVIKQVENGNIPYDAALKQGQALNKTKDGDLLFKANGADNHNLISVAGRYRTLNGKLADAESGGKSLNTLVIRNSAEPNPDADTRGGWRDCMLGMDGDAVYTISRV